MCVREGERKKERERKRERERTMNEKKAFYAPYSGIELCYIPDNESPTGQ